MYVYLCIHGGDREMGKLLKLKIYLMMSAAAEGERESERAKLCNNPIYENMATNLMLLL